MEDVKLHHAVLHFGDGVPYFKLSAVYLYLQRWLPWVTFPSEKTLLVNWERYVKKVQYSSYATLHYKIPCIKYLVLYRDISFSGPLNQVWRREFISGQVAVFRNN